MKYSQINRQVFAHNNRDKRGHKQQQPIPVKVVKVRPTASAARPS